jgi:hypothetical protein
MERYIVKREDNAGNVEQLTSKAQTKDKSVRRARKEAKAYLQIKPGFEFVPTNTGAYLHLKDTEHINFYIFESSLL